MPRKILLDSLSTETQENRLSRSAHFKLLNWNIRNPSLDRAKRQAKWIVQTGANVVTLTEAKRSTGCTFICDWLSRAGFDVFPSEQETNDYCVIMATKDLGSQRLRLDATFLPNRAGAITCVTERGRLQIVSLYVPSRGPLARKNVDKRAFQDQIVSLLPGWVGKSQNNQFIVTGDLNVLERHHAPHHKVFGEWEYIFYEEFGKSGLIDAYRLLHPDKTEHSWIGRSGSGYRFDHFFISERLSSYVQECSYIHSVRASGLSDHSAMCLELKFPSSVFASSLDKQNESNSTNYD